jgi:hypothetical protein
MDVIGLHVVVPAEDLQYIGIWSSPKNARASRSAPGDTATLTIMMVRLAVVQMARVARALRPDHTRLPHLDHASARPAA